jgi:hypothetical protein
VTDGVFVRRRARPEFGVRFESAREAVNVATDRRANVVRVGVVGALVAGALLALPAAPALASPGIENVSASPNSVEAGGTTEVSYRLKSPGPPTPSNVTVTSSNPKLSCVDGCTRTNVTQDGEYKAAFRLASDLASDAVATITIRATDATGEQQATTDVRLIAKPKPKTVNQISGKVTDSTTGEPVSGALVMISDSQNHRYDVISSESGAFRFTGSEQRPITPGEIQIGAKKDDVTVTRTITAAAGASVSTRLVLKLAAAAPTVSPSPEPAMSAPEETAAPTDTAAAAQPQTTSQQKSGGFGSWLLILLGGLLVALGVGAIVLLLVRRKEGGPEGDPRIGGAAAGGYRGAGDPTRVNAYAGAAANTGMPPHASLADAPTMMHPRPPADEFPDPYGAPLPQSPHGAGQDGGWAGNGYAGAAADGYGGGYGNAAAADGYGDGYGNAAAGNGYGGAPSAAGYAGPGGGAGYGAAPASGAGYGAHPTSGGGYGYPPGSGGGYGGEGGHGVGAGAPGYPGRDQGPPTQGGGHRTEPGGGYGDRYDEPTGRYQAGSGYGQAASPYDEGSYRPGRGHDGGYGPGEEYRHGHRQEYGHGGYDPPAGYGNGYGSAPGGEYDPRGGERYGPPGGYEQHGYDRVPEQRGYEADDYYSAQNPGDHADRGATHQPDRAQRRSVDWLDD